MEVNGKTRALLLVGLIALQPLTAQGQNAAGTAEFVSLDGKPVAAGNPTEDRPPYRVVKHFEAPVLWLLRSSTPHPVGTVLLCPGGGYAILETLPEGENTARALNAMGYDVALLEYHIASGAQERDLALADALKAFRLVKTSGTALSLHSTRLLLMGYSAGGHLAARTAAALGPNEQPDGVILVYPAYLEETTAGSSTPLVVPPTKPGRLFATIAVNDDAKRVQGCEAYAEAWKKAGGEADFHLLPSGGHGFGMTAKPEDSNQHWVDLLRTFLTGEGVK